MAFLRATLAAEPRDMGRQLDALLDKVQFFGGKIEELGSRGFVAIFGVEPTEDVVARSALAAMAMLRAAERERRQGDSIYLVVYANEVSVGRIGTTVQLDADARRQAWMLLEQVSGAARAGAILASRGAVLLLPRQFEFTPAEGATAGWPPIS